MARGMFSVSDLVKEKRGGKDDVASFFLKQLEDTILESQTPREPSTYYTPSSLNDMREMYFKRTGTPVDGDPIDSGLVGILENGEDRHNRIQHYLVLMKELGKDWEYIDPVKYVEDNKLDYLNFVARDGLEVHFIDTRYNLSFRTDGILKHISKNKYYIFEFKTEISMKNNYRTEHDILHRAQGCCYALSFGIYDVLYLYENRDTLVKKPFHFEVTPEEVKFRVTDKIEMVEDYVKKGIVPPRVKDTDIDPNFNEDDYKGTSKMRPSQKVERYSNYKKESAKWL